jgi:hypothetical protein
MVARAIGGDDCRSDGRQQTKDGEVKQDQELSLKMIRRSASIGMLETTKSCGGTAGGKRR